MNSANKEFFKFLEGNFTGSFLQEEPLSLHTWYKIGGPADFFLFPKTTDDLTNVLQQCQNLKLDSYLIGEGANILAGDDGFRGVVINLSKHFRKIIRQDDSIICDSGVKLENLILYCEKEDLGGLEYLSGIPGTVGGALIMNAGTHDTEICNCVEEVYCLDNNFGTVTLGRSEIGFGYRSAPQLQDRIIMGCKLKLSYKPNKTLKKVRKTQLKKRAAKQPLNYPSCGSFFKRPNSNYVGKMVEDLGLKGLKHGKAMVSDKHGGFIVNLGGAKAADIICLMKIIGKKVYDNYGIILEPEVRLLGF